MFEILYQDDYIVAINKPTGWLVHRSWLDRHEKTVVMLTLRDQIGQHVFPIHRLDRPTSGVLLFALSSEVANLFMQSFMKREPKKSYRAIVRGYIKESGVIDYPLLFEHDKIADKHQTGEQKIQEAITNYEPISTIEIPIVSQQFSTSRFSYIKLSPMTGRKHQLRRHMKHIFHPIIGDNKYGDLHQNRNFEQFFDYKRLYLHAKEYSFIHPVTNESILISVDVDEKWLNLIQNFTAV